METLNNIEIRILGCLLEKERTTPDLYPLSMNALKNGCNQKSKRFPVVTYDEDILSQGLLSLKEKKLVRQSNATRVVKWEQIFSNRLDLLLQEAAILCVLFLRGPQTVGEIRGRSARMYEFDGLTEAQRTLDHLSEMEYVKQLSREPGRKESRYIQLFGDTTVPESHDDSNAAVETATPGVSRLEAMENEIHELRQELTELQQEFINFKKEFE